MEPGALVLADGGICCIDEFNSISSHDRTTIHEAMEQQTLSVAKVGLVCVLRTRCSVIAATNPKGRYDNNQSISVNCALGTPLLSRFDLIYVLTDEADHKWDDQVASYILKTKLSSNPATNEFGGDTPENGDSSPIVIDPYSTLPVWPFETLQSYVLLVKQMFFPELSSPAKVILSRYFQFQRNTDRTSHDASRTSPRLLESLIRLAKAHARLMWRNTVDIQDSIVAIYLVEASIMGSSILPSANGEIWEDFPANPDARYEEYRDSILAYLHLEHLLVEVPASQDPPRPPSNGSSSTSPPNFREDNPNPYHRTTVPNSSQSPRQPFGDQPTSKISSSQTIEKSYPPPPPHLPPHSQLFSTEISSQRKYTHPTKSRFDHQQGIDPSFSTTLSSTTTTTTTSSSYQPFPYQPPQSQFTRNESLSPNHSPVYSISPDDSHQTSRLPKRNRFFQDV